jgi:hypothetical protein
MGMFKKIILNYAAEKQIEAEVKIKVFADMIVALADQPAAVSYAASQIASAKLHACVYKKFTKEHLENTEIPNAEFSVDELNEIITNPEFLERLASW